jgi:transcriptional regulator with XRE-family HTH domain
MGDIVRFRGRHARTSSRSASLRAARLAKASNVISDIPDDDAKRTMPGQWGLGMPRDRHPLTVESDCASAPATSPVPPQPSMIESQVRSIAAYSSQNANVSRFANCETTFLAEYAAISFMDGDDQDVARRLVAVRKKLGFESQTAFADKLDLTKSNYNPFETGERPLTIQVAKRIRQRFGVSVDYLLFGDIGQPKEGMALELGPRPKDDESPVKIKRPRKTRTG